MGPLPPARSCFAAALLAAAALASCAPGSDAPGTDPRPGGRVVIGVRGDVTSFNVYAATNAFSQEVADLLYLRLAVEQDDFEQGPPTFRPALATRWSFSPDRTTLTFELNPAARWSDGRPITAADVAFSHRAAASPEVAWVGSDVKEFVADLSTSDPGTVDYRFSRIYPYQLMDAVEGSVLPAHVHGEVPFTDWPRTAFLDAAVSSGPFRLARYERGTVIELSRNPDYLFAPLPRLDRVMFRIIPDEGALVDELLTGGLDMLENVSEEAARRLQSVEHLRLLRVPDLSYGFVCWNTARPLFADPRVRRALTLAIDRGAILEGLLPATGRPSAGPILSFMWAYDPSLSALPYDPAAARALLREAGWEDRDGDGTLDRDGRPFRFELETNQGSTLRASIVEMITAQLARVGVTAVPRVFEFGAFIERHERHEFDAFVGSWRESTKVDLKSVFHSSARQAGFNYGSYADAELDALIEAARAEADPTTARDLWHRAQRIIARDQPFTFLFERDRLHAIDRRIAGVRPSPRSAFAHLEEWSVAAPAAAGGP